MDSGVGRVVVVVNDLAPYGAQTVARAVAESLSQLGHHVTVVTLEEPGPDDLVLHHDVERVVLVRHSARGVRAYAGSVVGLHRTLRRLRPDLVISHMLLANITTLAAVAAPGRWPPVVVTEHNTTANLDIERSPRALAALARVLYPRARRVIGVSESVTRDVGARYRVPGGLLRTVLNPVDVAALRERARTSAGEPAHPWLRPGRDVPVLACVGAFRHAKGQELLVETLPLLPGVRAVLVGDGGTRAAVESRAAELGIKDRVVFLGFRSDTAAIMAAADALVVPSRWEGFGLVAVEAAAVGCPVVATPVTGLDELVGTRVPGVLAERRTPEALARAVTAALDGATAGTLDPSEFDPLVVAQRYIEAAKIS